MTSSRCPSCGKSDYVVHTTCDRKNRKTTSNHQCRITAPHEHYKCVPVYRWSSRGVLTNAGTGCGHRWTIRG